jgi:AraC-like DNA-binding protein
LACSWTAVPTGEHLLVPDACCDLVWLRPGRIVLCGPDTTGWRFSLAPGTRAVGVRFRPGVASSYFGVDLSEQHDRRVPLEQLSPAAQELVHLPGTDLSDHADPDDSLTQCRATLEQWVARHQPADGPNPFAGQLIDLLADRPSYGVAELAAELDMVARTLHRHTVRTFGYPPNTLIRIVRLQRFLGVLERDGPPLGRAAAEAGYADHAHLVRDCRLLTGLPPAEYLSDYFATFPDLSDPYKTASPLVDTVGS